MLLAGGNVGNLPPTGILKARLLPLQLGMCWICVGIQLAFISTRWRFYVK